MSSRSARKSSKKRRLSLRRPGRWKGADLLALGLLSALAACTYGFQGGGGFPAHIRTLHIESFELDRNVGLVEIPGEIRESLADRLPAALGVQLAGRDAADAVVRGTVTRYEDGAQNYRAATGGAALEVIEHQAEVTIQVEIVDLRRNVILWDSRNLVGRGAWLRETQVEAHGRARAIENLVQLIVDGALSQW